MNAKEARQLSEDAINADVARNKDYILGVITKCAGLSLTSITCNQTGPDGEYHRLCPTNATYLKKLGYKVTFYSYVDSPSGVSW